jgi:hypothetical protein
MDAARSLFREVGKAVGREARYMQDVGVMWGDYLGLEPQIWNGREHWKVQVMTLQPKVW